MKPEEKSREIINRLLTEAGWSVVDREHYAPTASAIAIEEGLLEGRQEADYLLFLDGKAIGVLEAKKKTTSLSDIVVAQAEGYAHGILDWYQVWFNPLPLIYLSNGKEILYRNLRDPSGKYIPVARIHEPKEVAKIFDLQSYFVGLPALSSRGLRKCQFEAISNLENSFRSGQKRALMVLATGSGKTFAACLASYRLLTYTPTKRILFLVDRNNLGKQAEGEFGTFRLTETADPFNTIYVTERLKSSHIPNDSNLVISTIQRLFAVITGEEIDDNDDLEDDVSYDENAPAVELTDNLSLPPDFFDVIIVDECHRSIYGRWKKVLEYFADARIIGLTATPAPETMAFFNNNRVVNYTLEQSIADGINVDCRVYRIRTAVTDQGGMIHKGEKIKVVEKYTGDTEEQTSDVDTPYRPTELDRAVVNESQIELVLQTFKDAVYSELYPEREANIAFLPKTLIFAKSDRHASDIVRIARKVFAGQSENFIQKITYSAGDSNELIRKFRNEKDFRMAVTVTLVATGTDVKPLEILLFMRDVNAESLFIQMMGRGVRTIGDEQLRNATPNATSKDNFYLVDAIGVTDHAYKVVKPGEGDDDGPQLPPLKILLEKITHGFLPDDYLKALAGKLARYHNKADEKQRSQFYELAGCEMKNIAEAVYRLLDEPEREPFVHVSEPNLARKAVVEPLVNHPDARHFLLVLAAGFLKILCPGEDTIIQQGFSKEDAKHTTSAFEEYINNHKDEIEALRIIYNNRGEPITYAILKNLEERLKSVNHKFQALTLWNAYSTLHPEKVVRLKQTERDLLTNLIQLVRFAFHSSPELRSLSSIAAQRFELWCGQTQRGPLTESQKNVLKEIVQYIVSNGTYTQDEMAENDLELLARTRREFGNVEDIKQLLISLSAFILTI